MKNKTDCPLGAWIHLGRILKPIFLAPEPDCLLQSRLDKPRCWDYHERDLKRAVPRLWL